LGIVWARACSNPTPNSLKNFTQPGFLAWIYSVFGSVLAVAFQIVFRAEIHANDVFFIF